MSAEKDGAWLQNSLLSTLQGWDGGSIGAIVDMVTNAKTDQEVEEVIQVCFSCSPNF